MTMDQCAMRHEMAHCYGWPENHPNAIYKSGCGTIYMPPDGQFLEDGSVNVTIVRGGKDQKVQCTSNDIPVAACSQPHGKTCTIFLSGG